MQSIQKKFLELKNIDSDINEHLDTLFHYAAHCNNIVEFGVRGVVSTWALLAGLKSGDSMLSVDISNCDVREIYECAKDIGINFEFIQSDTIDPNFSISECDLLFIDTKHTGEHVFAELNKHADNVKKFIIFHDTVTMWERDDFFDAPGLKYGMEPFLINHPEWKLVETFTNNNGLMVWERNN